MWRSCAHHVGVDRRGGDRAFHLGPARLQGKAGPAGPLHLRNRGIKQRQRALPMDRRGAYRGHGGLASRPLYAARAVHCRGHRLRPRCRSIAVGRLRDGNRRSQAVEGQGHRRVLLPRTDGRGFRESGVGRRLRGCAYRLALSSDPGACARRGSRWFRRPDAGDLRPEDHRARHRCPPQLRAVGSLRHGAAYRWG